MRKHKFRGKSTLLKKWVYGYYWFSDGEHLIKTEKPIQWGIDYIDTFEVIPETVGQFTGLFDKEEKEIYEGDVFDVIYSDVKNGVNNFNYDFEKITKGTVVFVNGAFKIQYMSLKYNEFAYDDLSTLLTRNKSILSNIHENKDGTR